MTTYPGLPGPIICDYLSRAASRGRYDPGVEFHIGRIEMVANTGTYVDSPFHRYADGADLAELRLESGGPGPVVVGPSRHRAIDREAFAGIDLGGRAVLVHTGWTHTGAQRYLANNPYLTAAAPGTGARCDW
jgi:kynurenine formamidase